MFGNDWVILPEDERILFCLVLENAELGFHIVLHFVFVAVKMVGRDVHNHGDVGLELIHVVELEAAQLDYIHIVF